MNHDYKRLKSIIAQLLIKVNYQETKHNGYKPKVKADEIITWIVWFYWCGCTSFKRYYYCWIKMFYKNCMCYSRFMHWKKRLSGVIKEILQEYIKTNNKNDDILIIDSSAIDLKTKTHERKTLSREASVGYSSTGKFFGFKVHIMINKLGKILKYKFTPGNENDITVVKKEGFFNNIQAKYILADSGYIDYKLKSNLKKQNIIYIAKPRINQEMQLLEFEKYKRIYKKRLIVESVFNLLKTHFNLSSTRFKSYESIELNWTCSILAYSFYKDSRQD